MQCPLALFPAKGDVPDAEEILEELKKKPFGEHCSLKRYDDQIHGVLRFLCLYFSTVRQPPRRHFTDFFSTSAHAGFVAARGEWSKPEVKKAADEVVGSVIGLFDKTLK